MKEGLEMRSQQQLAEGLTCRTQMSLVLAGGPSVRRSSAHFAEPDLSSRLDHREAVSFFRVQSDAKATER